MRYLQVVKIGANSVFNNGAIDYSALSKLGYDLAHLRHEKETGSVLVISGSITLGMRQRGLSERPNDMVELQSCARVGQPLLMDAYTKGLSRGYSLYFKDRNPVDLKLLTAQYLVTYHNLDDKKEIRNIVSGLKHDIVNGLVPLVNYNDGVDPTEVIRDNDTLAARITKALLANRLVILTDVDGLLDEESNLVQRVREIDDSTKALCRKQGKGVGSMQTKLEAADLLLKEGIPTIIGNLRYGLLELIENEAIRTTFTK